MKLTDGLRGLLQEAYEGGYLDADNGCTEDFTAWLKEKFGESRFAPCGGKLDGCD